MRCKNVLRDDSASAVTTPELEASAVTRGCELAWRAQLLFNSCDVYEIARRVGARIVSARWAQVTVGEYDRRTRTITINEAAIEAAIDKRFIVNRNAVKKPDDVTGQANCSLAVEAEANNKDDYFTACSLRRVIIAHELGHLLDDMLNPTHTPLSHSEQEQAAHAFAATLLALPFDVAHYEQLWQSKR